MRISINHGGLTGFFNGVSSFISNTNNNASSKALRKSFQTVIDKTNSLNGGIGTLAVAVGYMENRITAEEVRRIAINNVQRNADTFIQTAIAIDKNVALDVDKSTEEFYKNNPWLRPPRTPGSLERFFLSIVESHIKAWKSTIEFIKKHWDIIVTVAAVIAVIAVITLAIMSGGLVLVIAGAVIGGLAGGAGQLMSDVMSGEMSSFQTYLAAIAGGAVKGAVTAAIPGIGGKVMGSVAGKITEDLVAGNKISENLHNYAGAAIGGAISGGLGRAFDGVAGQAISKGIGGFAQELSGGYLGMAMGVDISSGEIWTKAISKGVMEGIAGGISEGLFGNMNTDFKESLRILKNSDMNLGNLSFNVMLTGLAPGALGDVIKKTIEGSIKPKTRFPMPGILIPGMA